MASQQLDIDYVPTCKDETVNQRKIRREQLRRVIKTASKKTNIETEVELERSCLEWKVTYVPTFEDETHKQIKTRRQRLRRAIKNSQKNFRT